MHSIHIIGSQTSGGAERFYSRLVCALHEAGESVLAVNQMGSAVSQQIGVRARQSHVRMRGVWDRLARWQMGTLVKHEQPDIVQTYMGRATRIFRKPRNGAFTHVARLGGFYNLSGYQHADAWIGNTRGICDHLVQGGMPSHKVFHLGNFVDIPAPGTFASADQLRAQLGLHTDSLVILFVGRLSANKGIPHLIQAMTKVPNEIGGRRTQLVVVGDGPDRATIEHQCQSLGLNERVSLCGWVADPSPYYASADLFVCPSTHEPLGNVVLEAWAYELAVVSTNSQGPSEYMTDGTNGWMVPVGEPSALASAITDALKADVTTRTALGRAGREEVERNHSRQGVLAGYMQVYESLCA